MANEMGKRYRCAKCGTELIVLSLELVRVRSAVADNLWRRRLKQTESCGAG